ncbi:MAG: ABC transporter ATP-binding protein [Proteobacteria bacterium]|nr:ABC transporter ATP-binding protein [Pseudomonadota bacterium]
MVMLSIRELSVRFGAVEVLDGVGFELAPGTVTALIGPNGAGKSSLMKAVAGLIPSRHVMTLNGRPSSRRNGAAHTVTYMPQDTGSASSLTIIEVVLLGQLRSLGFRVPMELRRAAVEALALFGLETLQTRTLDEVSGGQRQLVYLAQALFRRPPVLLLDEPTASLDLNHQLSVLDAVREHTRTRQMVTIIAMHDLTLAARFADNIICLNNGRKVSDGEPEAVLTPSHLRDIYQVETEIGKTKDGLITVTPLRST